MAETPRSNAKRKQDKQTLSPAGLTSLVTEDGNNSIIVSDSPPESQELKRRQRRSETKEANETGNALKEGQVTGQVTGNIMAAVVNKADSRGDEPELQPTPFISELSKKPTPEKAVGGQTGAAAAQDPVDGRAMTVGGSKHETGNGDTQPSGEPIKPRRGRPRKMGFSVDPILKPGSDDMMSVLLGITQDNVTLKTDILSNLDAKMSNFKEGLARELEPLKSSVKQQESEIEGIQKACEKQQAYMQTLDT